jgi:hypothetical protein
MKEIIGVIGISGDLGSQLGKRLVSSGFKVIGFSRSSPSTTLQLLADKCDIIHVCAPVESIIDLPKNNAIIVLHDSVMNTSRQANNDLLAGKGAVAHMLMNDHLTVVVASDAPHHDQITAHFTAAGLAPTTMTIDEHDYMIARSQAPLALLCKTVLPYLYEKADQGLLTPSGQLLADTLRSRELAWTDATIRSILNNPQLSSLINEMQATLRKYQ